MSSKPPRAKKAPAAAPAAPKKSPKRAAPQKKPEPAFFIIEASLRPLVVAAKPKGAKSPQSFATFGEAKVAAIESLVEAIEAAEAHLHALKRATSFDDLTA